MKPKDEVLKTSHVMNTWELGDAKFKELLVSAFLEILYDLNFMNTYNLHIYVVLPIQHL